MLKENKNLSLVIEELQSEMIKDTIPIPKEGIPDSEAEN